MEESRQAYEAAVEKALARFPERQNVFKTVSGREVERVYAPDSDDGSYLEKLGFPGQYPFTRKGCAQIVQAADAAVPRAGSSVGPQPASAWHLPNCRQLVELENVDPFVSTAHCGVAAGRASRSRTVSTIWEADVPGVNTAATPTSFKRATSLLGIVPPPNTMISSAPFSFSRSTTR